MKTNKTKIIEHDSNGNCVPVDRVYVVRQWNPNDDCMGYPAGVYTNYDTAVKVMKQLNKEYSFGMKWYKGKKYINGKIDDKAWKNAYLYYDIATLTLNDTDCL